MLFYFSVATNYQNFNGVIALLVINLADTGRVYHHRKGNISLHAPTSIIAEENAQPSWPDCTGKSDKPYQLAVQ